MTITQKNVINCAIEAILQSANNTIAEGKRMLQAMHLMTILLHNHQSAIKQIEDCKKRIIEVMEDIIDLSTEESRMLAEMARNRDHSL